MVSPTDSDNERIAEKLLIEYGTSIRDRESFQMAFENYFTGNMNQGIKNAREDVLNRYAKRVPSVRRESLLKEARGKDLKKDRQYEAKKIVTTEEEYKRQGARRVDLRGYDTPQSIIKFTEQKDFIFIGKAGKKTVYARQVEIHNQKKKRIVYRDRKGRFVRLLK